MRGRSNIRTLRGLGLHDNVDKLPTWRALGRIRCEQVLGQQF
jgi:hypothetical protein